LPQVLGLIDFKFDFDDSTFLSSLVSYLKAWREAMDLKTVFVLNLFSMLDETEIVSLSNELAYSGLSLVNISSFHEQYSTKTIKSVIVDNDLCVIG
jgi:CRISPR type II-A-associated protein Csn2